MKISELLMLVIVLAGFGVLVSFATNNKASASSVDQINGPAFQMDCSTSPCHVINVYTGETWIESVSNPNRARWIKMPADGGPEQSSTPWRD